MGIPAFFRYISEKYPKILVRAVEETSLDGNGRIDASRPNPNKYEFDNLYLDMNGLIHPCTHPEGEEPPETEEDMYLVIFRYVDRILDLVRPRKVIFMAIDGVAPRAKMNQQRSRRFRSAEEAAEAQQDSERVRNEMTGLGLRPPPKGKPAWDSNVITPGTEFMAKLSIWLRYYIANRMNTNPALKNVRIVLSDAQSPGEGEHKIMNFIRKQRVQPGYDPNTTHVMYGLDADLVMLGLASHEVHFTILREEVLFGNKKKRIREESGYKADPVLLANGEVDESAVGDLEKKGFIGRCQKPFDLLRLWVLREYLALEFHPSRFYGPLQFEYNFEACIDDFVFICFFIGNDFLPHIPSLSIREGGVDLLLDLYLRVLPTMQGYLTTNGVVNLSRVDVFIGILGEVEDEIFKRRRRVELSEKNRRQQMNKMRREGGYGASMAATVSVHSAPMVKRSKLANESGGVHRNAEVAQKSLAPNSTENKGAAKRLRDSLRNNDSQVVFGSVSSPCVNPKLEAKPTSEAITGIGQDTALTLKPSDIKAEGNVNMVEFERLNGEARKSRNFDDAVQDDVMLGEEGWKERYYKSKFGENFASPSSPDRRKVVEEYVLGLCWVLLYYYQGVQSWTWYYPYHYAPFASDLVNIDNVKIEFPPSKPFKPFEQLMGVFPSASAHALPKPFRWYMCSEDSPIEDFYPKKLQFDQNGQTMRWLWVVLLPFIDEKRLLEVSRKVDPELSEDEKERNSLHADLIFCHTDVASTANILKSADELVVRRLANRSLLAKSNDDQARIATTQKEDQTNEDDHGRLLLATDTDGVSGYFKYPSDNFRIAKDHDVDAPDTQLPKIRKNKVLCFEFESQDQSPTSRILRGVKFPPRELSMEDMSGRNPMRNGRSAQVATILIEKLGGRRSEGQYRREPQGSYYNGPLPPIAKNDRYGGQNSGSGAAYGYNQSYQRDSRDYNRGNAYDRRDGYAGRNQYYRNPQDYTNYSYDRRYQTSSSYMERRPPLQKNPSNYDQGLSHSARGMPPNGNRGSHFQGPSQRPYGQDSVNRPRQRQDMYNDRWKHVQQSSQVPTAIPPSSGGNAEGRNELMSSLAQALNSRSKKTTGK